MNNESFAEATEKKKSHRIKKSGRKVELKKKQLQKNDPTLTDKQRNPKAFAFHSAVKAQKRFRHKQDVEVKKQHIPLVDRTPLEPPPILIGIVGPPKVGKTTLISSLIKLFTKTTLIDVKGPVTIVTGKKRRITLIECNNDVSAMIDLAKVADLVLLLCDASFGFEMEVFEFLNICQVHGMPRIMGILTHLDMIKNSKALKTTKKTLKHRFWTEVYPGAKLFYLSGILHGEYLRNEIKNLGRFISIMKFRPLTWRTTHSYLLADRYEDLTSQELIRKNPKCDRNISLYGYLRGINLNKECSVHIAGLGDYPIQEISFLPDPCPLPETIKKRALIEKEKFIYAPFSGVGGIVYDKDAVYVELGGSHSHQQVNDNDIVTNLIRTEETLDAKMEKSTLKLFTEGEHLTGADFENTQSNGVDHKDLYYYQNPQKEEEELHDELKTLRSKEANDNIRRKVIFEKDDEEFLHALENGESDDENDSLSDNDEDLKEEPSITPVKTGGNEVHEKITGILKRLDEKQKANTQDESSDEEDGEIEKDFEDNSDDDDSENLEVKWKDNLISKAAQSHSKRQNIMKTVYGVFERDLFNKPNRSEEELPKDDDVIGGLFRIAQYQKHKDKVEKDNMDIFESPLIDRCDTKAQKSWLDPDNKTLIQNCFVTGKWRDDEDAENLLKLDDNEDINSDADSEVFGDFEDLETGEKFASEAPNTKKRPLEEDQDNSQKNKLTEKKRKLKEKFDAEYDNTDKSYYDNLKMELEKQSQLNKTVFENLPDDLRVQIEGHRPGMYVRLEFQKIPAEFINYFDPTYPLVVGALNMGEENIGYVNVKIKKHRWYKKILKTNDPLVISLGWRRFQTVPLFSKLEDDLKFRYLKYTPEHVTCNAHFWGPITPQGTGFLALQTFDENSLMTKQSFRIAATGAVQELDKSTKIMKKLKLIGHPLKIYKKTAFVKGMFNSSLEVARFEGAQIKTVSGIRGQIKKANNKPEGSFRATFEDKIQLSDIVFCRTWFKVAVPQFYNPVITLLLPSEKRRLWRGARTTGQIKREEYIRNQPDKDSLYTAIVRETKVFKPLIVPRKLQAALPYRDKPKFAALPDKTKQPIQRVAVIREPHEQKVSHMMKMLRASFEHKQETLKIKMKENMERHKREIEDTNNKKLKKLQTQKKQVMRNKSKAQLSAKKKGSNTK